MLEIKSEIIAEVKAEINKSMNSSRQIIPEKEVVSINSNKSISSSDLTFLI
jgi:hypothetical protein